MPLLLTGRMRWSLSSVKHERRMRKRWWEGRWIPLFRQKNDIDVSWQCWTVDIDVSKCCDDRNFLSTCDDTSFNVVFPSDFLCCPKNWGAKSKAPSSRQEKQGKALPRSLFRWTGVITVVHLDHVSHSENPTKSSSWVCAESMQHFSQNRKP